MEEQKQRGGSRRSARRETILDHAMRRFSEHPYDDVSIDDVCQDAGVAHGLVSYYFGSKGGLFTAVVEKAWQDMLEYERPRDDEANGPERVRGYVRRHFEYVQRHAERFSGLMYNDSSGPPHIREIAQAARREARAALLHSLGCPTDPPPRLRTAMHGWAGYLDNITVDWLSHDDMELEEVTEHCVQALVAIVGVANGDRFDLEKQNAALAAVSGESETATPVAAQHA